MEDGKSITEDEHTEFYRYTLQYKIDVPINLRALIYIPQYKPSLLKDDLSKKKLFNFELDIFDVTQEAEVGVALYSRKVLIQSKANQLLPRWLRFVKGNSSFSVIQKTLFILGVVDSEDIPLNLSRELLQDSNLIRFVSFYENP
jgi:TNF receptor-associated protein 1